MKHELFSYFLHTVMIHSLHQSITQLMNQHSKFYCDTNFLIHSILNGGCRGRARQYVSIMLPRTMCD